MKKVKKGLMKPMMTMLLNSMSVLGLSQDTIIMSDNTHRVSKVLEINETEIKYKRFDNIDGPEYLIAKGNIFLIKYKNGTIDSFPVLKPWLLPVKKNAEEIVPQKEITQLISSKIIFDGNHYLFNSDKLNEREIQNVLKEKNNKELNTYVRNTRLSRVFQPLTNLGFPAITAGAVMVLLANNGAWKKDENDTNMNTGESLIAFSSFCLAASFYLHWNIKKQNKKEVALYNQLY